MRIEPEIPEMSEVTLDSITYEWKRGDSIESMTIDTSPYILDVDMGSNMMTTPVKVIYNMSNGNHEMLVHPNGTDANDFESGSDHSGTMVGYPKVKMIDMGVAVRVRAKVIDYVSDAGSIPFITIVDSENRVKISNHNSVFMKSINPTELYLVKVYNDYSSSSKYNTEYAVYPLVRGIMDSSSNVIVNITTSYNIHTTLFEYRYHKHLTDIEDITVKINGIVGTIPHDIDDGIITVELPNGLTSDDEVEIIFELYMYVDGTREKREIIKTVYIGV